jgi:hypothetical protein
VTKVVFSSIVLLEQLGGVNDAVVSGAEEEGAPSNWNCAAGSIGSNNAFTLNTNSL